VLKCADSASKPRQKKLWFAEQLLKKHGTGKQCALAFWSLRRTADAHEGVAHFDHAILHGGAVFCKAFYCQASAAR
jgi:hypothetical protein